MRILKVFSIAWALLAFTAATSLLLDEVNGNGWKSLNAIQRFEQLTIFIFIFCPILLWPSFYAANWIKNHAINSKQSSGWRLFINICILSFFILFALVLFVMAVLSSVNS